jgi:predicted MFS family arabinose efflux permease
MFSRRLKTGYFVLEGLNSFATVYYFYYFYFFMQKAFGFGNQANLLLAALNGATYAVCAWGGGRFAQRFGYFRALKLGFVIMILALALGSRLNSALGHTLVMCVTVVGMSFTWPTLEALVSEGESRTGLQQMVGLYNVVWAAAAALANFCGGAMLDKFGLNSLFYVPIVVQLGQLALTFWLESQARPAGLLPPATEGRGALGADQAARVLHTSTQPLPHPLPAAQVQSFLRMAWLANPFAYIAINTLLATLPGIALHLKLSTTLAGFCCSVWCFARLASFVALWPWSGWHYKFRWLLLAYVGLVGSFAAILLAPRLAVLVIAQLFFGAAIGLIYYSSLFYSMDLSQSKGEHGGIHEAVIGLGNFAGPAVGAAALQFVPRSPNSGALAVTLLLLCGLGGLAVIWRSGRRP